MGSHNETGIIHQDMDIIDLTGLSITSSDDSMCDLDREMSENASVPWYQDPNGSHPFSLTAKSRALYSPAPSYTQVEFFPWQETPLEHLWNGDVYTAKKDPKSWWLSSVRKWRDTAVVCGGKVVRLIHTSPQLHGSSIFQIALPAKCSFTVSHVKWALNPWDLHPLLIYVHSSVLHVFDVEARNFLGCIRGHGGYITSLGVHHLHPHLVFTTSRDCTTRIYDFRTAPNAGKESDASGTNHTNGSGMRIDIDGGDCALGKCVVVLAGGRSGGHEAAVLGADFHPSLPLIATCGIDHALRIWHLRPALYLKDRYLTTFTTLNREDKPLFSSTTIHDARVLSVNWLSHETLLSQSAPRLARLNGSAVQGLSGTLAVWKWLSVGRFFPPGASIYQEPPLRGCISDYRESSSFKMISISRLPVDASRVFVNRNSRRPPLILIPVRSQIILINASHLAPRNRPTLVDDRDGMKLRAAKKARVAEDIRNHPHSEIEGWTLSVAIGEDLEDEDVAGCVMSSDGQHVAGVGTREGVWLWSSV